MHNLTIRSIIRGLEVLLRFRNTDTPGSTRQRVVVI